MIIVQIGIPMTRRANPIIERFATVTLLVVALLFTAGFSSKAPSALPYWKASSKASTQKIDHSDWGALLSRYIRTDKAGLNRFAYGKVSKADKAKLSRYIDSLAAVKITRHSRKEQLAYWINLYNALTIKVILDNYPVKSIREISSGVFSRGPWGSKLVKVEGRNLTLDDIEHRILRPIWRDPRIHYGVNCASIGCPNLQKKPFTGDNASKLLTIGARQYINSPRGVTVKGNDIKVSKIYDWFAYDFGNSEKGVLKHLQKYAKPKLARELRRIGRIDDTEYDWDLNG